MDKGLVLAAMVAVASFAIDRISAATFFLLSFSDAWSRWLPDPRFIADERGKAAAERKLKLIYYCFAGALRSSLPTRGTCVSWLSSSPASDLIDWLFTAIVLAGGSGQIAELLHAPHTGKLPASTPEPLDSRGPSPFTTPVRRSAASASSPARASRCARSTSRLPDFPTGPAPATRTQARSRRRSARRSHRARAVLSPHPARPSTS